MVLQVWWHNQQCQSTEGGWLVIQTGLSLTRLTSPCYNNTVSKLNDSVVNGPLCRDPSPPTQYRLVIRATVLRVKRMTQPTVSKYWRKEERTPIQLMYNDCGLLLAIFKRLGKFPHKNINSQSLPESTQPFSEMPVQTSYMQGWLLQNQRCELTTTVLNHGLTRITKCVCKPILKFALNSVSNQPVRI